MKSWPACVALCLVAATARADTARPQEQLRLDRFDAIAGEALLAAFAGGSRGDVDLLQDALAGNAMPALETTLAGDWTCRTLKLGGLLPLTTYAPFACRFTPDGDGFIFEKLTGSQRTSGRVSLKDGRMIYLGVGYVDGVTPTAYADLPGRFEGNGETQPQIAVVEQTDANHARMSFPAPVVESDFDILFLTR